MIRGVGKGMTKKNDVNFSCRIDLKEINNNIFINR